MTNTDIHSCGYYCDRHACIVAQRNELRDKLFEGQAVKTYSGGKPNYTQPIEQEPVAYINIEERMTDNIIPFGGITRLDVDPDRVLTSAVGKMDCVVICGVDKDGNEFFASSMSDGAEALWYLERCKKMLLEMPDD